MEIEIKTENGVTFVIPRTSSLDSLTSAPFKGKFIDLINQGSRFFILNLSSIEFMDSRGLGAIISILKNLTPVKGILVLCELKPQIVNLLNITNMHKVFLVSKDEREALNMLQDSKNNNG